MRPLYFLHFVYDGQSIVLQFDDTTLSHRYFNGPQLDQVLADEAVGSSVVWVYADNLGSVRDLSDASGNWTSHIAYDSFGHVTNTPDATILFGFTGAAHDGETNLDYHRARYYDATIGRWITQDPIGLTVDSNPYRYVENSPTRGIDPSGLSTLTLNPGSVGGMSWTNAALLATLVTRNISSR